MSLPTRSVYQHNVPSHSGNKPFGETLGKTDNPKREPLKCWGCGEERLLRDCPHRQQNSRRAYNIQEATTINDVARSMPQIYAALDNKQVDHQASVVEMEGMIVDPGSNLSYVSPHTVDK
jgi:CRISPR/Cas system-associated protein Cas10 (large subunit of type III CRISPR-Cas system)